MKKVNIKSSKTIRNKVKELYYQAFPKEELIPWWLVKMMNRRKGADVSAYMDNDIFCGFTYTYTIDEMLFVFYFAVNDELRGKGYGSKILTMLKEENPEKTITLNIEPLEENAINIEQRRKRFSFYKKNGFYDTGYSVTDIGGDFTALSTRDDFDVETYRKLFRRLTLGLMRVDVKKRKL